MTYGGEKPRTPRSWTGEVSDLPATPELDRRSEVLRSGRAATLTEFVDWCDEQGWTLCALDGNGYFRGDGSEVQEYAPVYEPRERMFERFFGLDGDAMEQEKRALLEHLRQRS